MAWGDAAGEWRGRGRLLAVKLSLSVMALLPAGCGTSPGTFGARLTSQGALLVDGPPSRMNADAVLAVQAQQVPMLYAFALGAGQPLASATDLASQQAALRGSGINWQAVAASGEDYVDLQCNNFTAALHNLERSKKTTLTNLNTVQAATVGIMGLAKAAQEAIGIVGISFGLAANLFDTTVGTVLYELPASAVVSVVQAQRQLLRAEEDPARPSPAWQRIRNQADAADRINQYLQYCVPVTIEANITKVLSNTRAGSNQDLVSTPTPAAASGGALPALVPTPAIPGEPVSSGPSSPIVATPPPPTADRIGGAMSPNEASLFRAQGKAIQAALCLPPDQRTGVFGRETRAAIRSWRSATQASPPDTPLTVREIQQLFDKRACPPIFRNAYESVEYRTSDSVRQLQDQLSTVLGVAVPRNGVLDDETRNAIVAAQRSKHLPITGAMTRELADAIAL
jgi:hypothetical protein